VFGSGTLNVLLDLDGTLTDSREGIVACMVHTLRTLGHAVPDVEVLLGYVGPPLRTAFRQLLRSPSEAELEHAIRVYRERFVPVGMYENRVYPGVPEALQRLRERGARLFVATSKAQVYARRILDHFELSHHFEEIYGSELDGRLGDKGELIAHALAASRLHAADSIMVGDRHHDAAGAIANRVMPVGALWGYGSREELYSAGAEVLLEAPADLGALASRRVTEPVT
jgi:phosphoglycolate phosphatase